MSVIKDLVCKLQDQGLNAYWESTGGGCMAVAVYFGPELASGYYRYEILITDREDVFTESDYNSDDDVWGFHAGFYSYDETGERECEGIAVYYTANGAGESRRAVRDAEYNGDVLKLLDVRAEMTACADVVAFIVEKVLWADQGRFLTS